MQLITLYSPQGAQVGAILQPEMNSFLQSHGLVARRRFAAKASFVVMESALAELLERSADDHVEIRRKYCPNAELAAFFRGVTERGKTAIYRPTMTGLRHYYNLDGFIRCMGEVASHVPNSRIVVPAGDYGDRLLFGIAPADRS